MELCLGKSWGLDLGRTGEEGSTEEGAGLQGLWGLSLNNRGAPGVSELKSRRGPVLLG